MKAKVTYTETNTVKPKAKQPSRQGKSTAQEAGPKETQSGLRGSVALPGGLPGQPTPPVASLREVPVTTIEAKVDVGCGNGLFIRGEGAGLSWEKGKAMDCVEASRWVWSTNQVPDKLVFKVLLNDQGWSQGENATVAAGQKIEVAPVF